MPVTIHHTRVLAPDAVYLYLAKDGKPETNGMLQFESPQPHTMKRRHLPIPSTWEPSCTHPTHY